jgi:hypothetical protein
MLVQYPGKTKCYTRWIHVKFVLSILVHFYCVIFFQLGLLKKCVLITSIITQKQPILKYARVQWIRKF